MKKGGYESGCDSPASCCIMTRIKISYPRSRYMNQVLLSALILLLTAVLVSMRPVRRIGSILDRKR